MPKQTKSTSSEEKLQLDVIQKQSGRLKEVITSLADYFGEFSKLEIKSKDGISSVKDEIKSLNKDLTTCNRILRKYTLLLMNLQNDLEEGK